MIEYTDEDEELKYTDAHLFTAFCLLRQDLAKDKKILLCKGCRIDVYPFGSQLKWIFAFKLTLNKNVNQEKDLVVIFDEELDISKIGSIEEQKLFYKKWLKSVHASP